MTVPSFLSRVDRSMGSGPLGLCCGLDPDLTKLPSEYDTVEDQGERVEQFLGEVVRLTSASVSAYKIQKAFFDVLPSGYRVLESVVNAIRNVVPALPVIIDAKVADIDNTLSAYRTRVFDQIGADALVVNPYMGPHVWESLDAGRGAVVLVRTSNPEAAVVQNVKLASGLPLWSHILNLVSDAWRAGLEVMPVLSANATDDFAAAMSQIPDGMVVFIAGVGVQGGQVASLADIAPSCVRGLVNSSRAILYPYERSEASWRDAVIEAIREVSVELDAL